MKIGIIAPLAYPVPPQKYGGTELVIYNIAEGMVKRGHEVELFACAGSSSSAKIDQYFDRQLVGANYAPENLFYSLSRIKHIIERSAEFDIIHNHDGLLPISLSSYCACPMISTIHTMIERTLAGDQARAELLKAANLVSISYSQRKGLADANYISNVYNGTVDFDVYKFHSGGDSLFWLGRFNPYKGAKEAVEVARLTGKKLILAGKIYPEEQPYFDREIKPFIDNDQIKYVGEIDVDGKNQYFGRSRALLMPITWEEPFGLVMIEAMACGIPVIAFDRGSVSEIIKQNETGFIVQNTAEMAEAVNKLYSMDSDSYQNLKNNCRAHVMNNFSIEQMVAGYESAYQQVINEKNGQNHG